jgi:serine/threonine-protein kinase
MPPTHTLEGLNAAAEIRSHYPATGVVVLSQFLAANYALRLLSESSSPIVCSAAGASGALLRHLPPSMS